MVTGYGHGDARRQDAATAGRQSATLSRLIPGTTYTITVQGVRGSGFSKAVSTAAALVTADSGGTTMTNETTDAS